MDTAETPKKRTRVSQSDIPLHPLKDALKVAQIICDQFAKQPAKPLSVADAMQIKPSSSRLRTLAGAALAYGLTTAAYNAAEIGLTELGRRCVAPTTEGDDQRAMREAFLKPRVIAEFLGKYNGSRLPSERIAHNVLNDEMGVPKERTASVFQMIVDGVKEYGMYKEIKGDMYIDLESVPPSGSTTQAPEDMGIIETIERYEATQPQEVIGDEVTAAPANIPASTNMQNKRVFITHGKNKEIVGQLKELLTFGQFEPVVSVENETTAKPVPQKVMDDMRSCSAAVIHVGQEQHLLNAEGEEVHSLNQNVLIEIGAAMALYGQKFILLVEKGTKLPSNLSGLYEVRYEGEKLDYEATMKLLKAFNEFSKVDSV